MTILHIMQCTNLGGMEQVAFRVMGELAREHGIKFRIVTPTPFGPGMSQVLEFDPTSRDFPYRGRFGWRDFWQFRAHVRELANDCSHVWITGTSAAALAAVKGISLPVVLSHHYHHFEERWSGLKWRMFYEIMCHDINTITYPTCFTRDEALRIAPWLAAKAEVVPNGFQLHFTDEIDRKARQSDARRRLHLPANAFVVGNAGWLIKRKRFDVFLRTAEKIQAVLPNACFVICGGGPEEQSLRELAVERNIAGVVRFEGWISDLSDYYRAFDVLLFNSDFDTLPCAPMEAASYGCPTVASLRYGGLSEFIVHGTNGFLFTDHDAEALAKAILTLANDESFAKRLRWAARQRLQTHFSPKASTRFYQLFFESNYSATESRNYL